MRDGDDASVEAVADESFERLRHRRTSLARAHHEESFELVEIVDRGPDRQSCAIETHEVADEPLRITRSQDPLEYLPDAPLSPML